MKYIAYKPSGNIDNLYVEEVSVRSIANKVGTPFYCYSKKTLLENYHNFCATLSGINYRICYAVKANVNTHVIKVLADAGSGADVVSAGEIFRALKSGVKPQNIVFAGVGKKYDEIEYALKNDVYEFSAESEAEIFMLNEVALKLSKKVKLSLRVNPNVDAKTHDKISTGRKEDKFGIDINSAIELYQKASLLPGIEIHGISVHIGSQITSAAPFKEAFLKVRDLFFELKEKGINIKSLDFGGGVGIFYKDEKNSSLIEDYGALIKEVVKDLDVTVTIAPGRAITGNAGVLVSSVTLTKKADTKNFLIIDAGMNDLMRPGLYNAYHEVIPESIKNVAAIQSFVYDLCGPVCETTDVLAKERKLRELKSGDLVVFCGAGAYGSSMSNEYNVRPLIPEVMVDGDKFFVIRRRPSFEEMITLEQ